MGLCRKLTTGGGIFLDVDAAAAPGTTGRIVFGLSQDASIGWADPGNYLEVASADTHFSGTCTSHRSNNAYRWGNYPCRFGTAITLTGGGSAPSIGAEIS